MAKKTGEIENQSLENFQWEENESTFFGIEGTAPEQEVFEAVKEEETEEEIEEKAKPKPKAVASKNETTEDNDEDDDVPNTKTETSTFFEQETDEDGKPKATATEDDDEDEPVDIVTLIKSGELFDHVVVDEKEELTVERIKELVQENTDNQIEEIIEGFKDDAGEDGVAFFKFISNGGDAKTFLKLWKESAEIPEVDVTTEEGQDEIIEFYLDNYENLDKEDKKDRIAWFEESGKKKKYAEKYQAEIVADYEKRKQALVEEQKKLVELQEQKRKEVANSLKDKLVSSEKIGSYSITKEDKKSLVDAITKSTVKVGSNKYITPLQQKISEIYKDPEKLILLAKVVMSDFDTSDIETAVATKVVSKVKTKLATSGKTVLSSQPKPKNRSLSEFF